MRIFSFFLKWKINWFFEMTVCFLFSFWFALFLFELVNAQMMNSTEIFMKFVCTKKRCLHVKHQVWSNVQWSTQSHEHTPSHKCFFFFLFRCCYFCLLLFPSSSIAIVIDSTSYCVQSIKWRWWSLFKKQNKDW